MLLFAERGRGQEEEFKICQGDYYNYKKIISKEVRK